MKNSKHFDLSVAGGLLELMQRVQSGHASCMFAANLIEKSADIERYDLEGAFQVTDRARLRLLEDRNHLQEENNRLHSELSEFCRRMAGWLDTPHGNVVTLRSQLSVANNAYDRMEKEIAQLEKENEALRVVLDHVDYTTGACKPTEMVGAVLPTNIIARVKVALKLI